MEFQYVIDASADKPIMCILTHIGYDPDMGYGVDGNAFLRELLALDNMGKSGIEIWINSVGGSVIDGWSIVGGMLKTKTKIDTCNIGIAASTAGWIFQAGRTRKMCDYALWMGHNPYSSTGDNSEILTRMRDSIITTISQRTGMDETKVGAMLDRETYMSASEALANNFCDEIQATSSLNVKRISSAATVTDKWKEALSITNISLPNKKPIMSTENKIATSVTNKLKLHDAASEVMVVEAIEGLQNKIAVTETNLIVAENKVAAKDNELSEMKKKCNELEEEVASYKSMIEEAEEEVRMSNAVNMVKGYADAGKIANEDKVITEWANFANMGKTKDEKKASFDRIENMLKGIAVNKAAEKINVVNAAPSAMTGAQRVALAMSKISKEKNN